MKINPLKKCGIYKITNLLTDQFYIGKSKNIQTRWYQHKTEAKKNNYNLLYSDMNTFGIENFKIEVIEECKESELNQREHYYIYTLDPFYNNTSGLDYSISNHKLTKNEILNIQGDLIKGINKKELSEKFNVSINTINNINSGRSWHNNSFNYPLFNTLNNYPEGFLDYLNRIHKNFEIDDFYF